jgi:type IX secretion system PorP/SprF family membrane protein
MVIVAFAFGITLQAQQKSLYSQYMFNTFLFNPAAAGAEGATSINLTGREQWVGFTGAPKTHSVSAETRILKNSYIAKALSLRKKFSKRSASGRVGVGMHIFNDFSGPMSRSGIQIAYGYHIPLKRNQLSFGVAVEPYQLNINKTKLENIDKSDLLIANMKPRYVIDGNFGVQYTAPLWYAGLSATDLFQSNIYFGDPTDAGHKIVRHYWMTGGYKIVVNRMVMIEPTTLMKFTESGTFQMDLSGRAFYREDYWGGLTYRTGAGAGALVFMAGLRYQRYLFGYAFDYTLNPLMQYTYGTHEFMFTLKFGENARRYRWLNRY